MKLYLVRHGQSTGNVSGTLMGQSDHPLTPLGEDQARAAADLLAPYGPMPMHASDLPRARATAEHIVAAWDETPKSGAPRISLDPRLREISLGDYEGRPWQDFEADTALTASFVADPYRTPMPNGESLEHLEQRAHAAVLDILTLFGVDDTGARCDNVVEQSDASTAGRDAEAMKAGAAAAAIEAASAVDAGSAGSMEPSAVATGLLPVAGSGSACLVAHDGPIRAIINHYLGVPPHKWWTLSTTHGGVSLIEFAGGCVTVRYVNATGHLSGLEPDRYVPADD